MDRLGRNLGGNIPLCSQYWTCYITPLPMGLGRRLSGRVQHFCYKTVSLVLVVTANRTVNVLVLWGVEIKNIHNDETWMTVPLWSLTHSLLRLTS